MSELRAATAADHQAVDDRFGAFTLDDASGYRRFLTAHGRALPAVEAVLARDPDLPAWRPRTAALAADLAALGEELPAPLPFALPAAAARWGALYVVEGSRLGGQLLARSVGEGMPAAYLSARHEAGAWRTLLARIEAQAAGSDAAWRTAAIAGARATFALYAEAAGVDVPPQ